MNEALRTLFLDLKEGAKVISLKSFKTENSSTSKRNLNDVASIFDVTQYDWVKGDVSWGDGTGMLLTFSYATVCPNAIMTMQAITTLAPSTDQSWVGWMIPPPSWLAPGTVLLVENKAKETERNELCGLPLGYYIIVYCIRSHSGSGTPLSQHFLFFLPMCFLYLRSRRSGLIIVLYFPSTIPVFDNT